MPILTLTTDFGTNSFEVAALKGSLLCASPSVQLIDISHHIGAFDKMAAAYAMKNASLRFPNFSIHFTNINLKEGNNRFLIVARKNQFYLCPDNGLISMMFPKEDFKAYVMQGLEKDFSYSELHHILCSIVQYAEKNEDISTFGVETTSYLRVPTVRAAVMPDAIRASIIYIDSFENLVTNVSKNMFYDFVQDRPFTISTRGNRVHRIHKHYSETEAGEMLCLFNEAGFLEIAIAHGSAKQLLGLEYGNIIIIEKD